MPDRSRPALLRWGGAWRRQLVSHSGCGTSSAAAGAVIAVTALLATSLWPPRPLLVWNASASSPPGLYLVASPRNLKKGAMVVAWAPDDARRLGAERHYVPANVPLVKRVSAVAGDRVCAVGGDVFVNGRLETLRRSHDGVGRPMPWWTGCEDIRKGDAFLLTVAPDSFDGRYFGITRARDIVGSARLIWAKPAQGSDDE